MRDYKCPCCLQVSSEEEWATAHAIDDEGYDVYILTEGHWACPNCEQTDMVAITRKRYDDLLELEATYQCMMGRPYVGICDYEEEECEDET